MSIVLHILLAFASLASRRVLDSWEMFNKNSLGDQIVAFEPPLTKTQEHDPGHANEKSSPQNVALGKDVIHCGPSKSRKTTGYSQFPGAAALVCWHPVPVCWHCVDLANC